MAKDGAMPETIPGTKTKTLTVLKHKTKEWKNVLHHWQVRSLDDLQWAQGKIFLSDQYPNIAIICADWKIEDKQVENWFANSPDELDNIVIHYFPDVPKEVPKESMFSVTSETILKSEEEKKNNF
jgi:hypothetical protein